MIPVNKMGADWMAIKKWLNEKIMQAQSDMESGQPMEQYHRLCGQIAIARLLLDEVEPATPPITNEDHYGISTPE